MLNKILKKKLTGITLGLLFAVIIFGVAGYKRYVPSLPPKIQTPTPASPKSFSDFQAIPNTVIACSKEMPGTTSLTWNVQPGVYQILRGGDTGVAITNATSSGFLNIDNISEDTDFVLQQGQIKVSAENQTTPPEQPDPKNYTWSTISKLTVKTITIGCNDTTTTRKVAGPVRGITFHFLDGWDHDLPWMIENQYNSQVRKQIETVLDSFVETGINWLRIIIAAHHRPYYQYVDSGNPLPSNVHIKQVNDFLALLRSNRFTDKFKIELVLIPEMNKDLSFRDSAPFTLDKQWINSWMNKLDFTNIGIVMMGADLMPCAWEGSQIKFRCGDASGSRVTQTHARWIQSVWPWARQNWPNQNMSYEVIAGSSTLAASTMATWVSEHTPDVTVAAASMYFDLPIGATVQDYANYWRDVITSFRNHSVKPLWIDEFGKRIGTGYSESDQEYFFEGFLRATVCGDFPDSIPKLAWVGGDDYKKSRKIWFGLFSGYAPDNTPKFRPAWKSLSKYYNAQQCP